jgi:hypothetical protein
MNEQLVEYMQTGQIKYVSGRDQGFRILSWGGRCGDDRLRADAMSQCCYFAVFFK